MTSIAVPVSGGGEPRPRGRRWLRPAAWGLPVLVAVAWLAPVIALALVGSGLVAWLAARPKRAFLAFCCLLPLHTLMVAAVFGVLGLPETVTRAIAAWKEGLVLVVFVAMLVRVATGRGAGARVGWLDLVIGAMGAIILGNLVGREAYGGDTVPLVGQLYGVRDSGIFLLLYLVGRSGGAEMTTDGVVDTLFAVGVMLAIVAILERLFVPPELLVAIGTTKYYREFLNLGVMLRDDEVGLPANYYTEIGGLNIPRAGSTFLSSQGFAIAYLLIMPAAALSLLRRDRRAGILRWVAFGVSWIGLLLSLTRMSIVCALIEAGIVAWYLHRRAAIVGVLAAAAGVVVMAIAFVRGFGTFLLDSLTFKTSSGEVHVQEWSNGIAAVLDHPFGLGLATADVLGDRFGSVHITGDNLYIKFAVELGLPAVALLIVILLAFAVRARQLALTGSSTPLRHYGILILAMTFGIVANSVSTVLFTSQFIAYLYFWMAGALVTIVASERRVRA